MNRKDESTYEYSPEKRTPFFPEEDSERTSLFKKDESIKTITLKSRLAELAEHEKFIFEIEEEFEVMINILIDIEKLPENPLFTCPIDFADVLKSLIGLVDVKGRVIRKDLMIIGLKVFRNIIERQNKISNEAAADWDGDEWTKYKNKIALKQEELCDLGMVQLVYNVISNIRNMEVQQEALMLGIALLIGGNTKIQKKFLECMQNDPQNKFLDVIRNSLNNNFGMVKKEMNLRNKVYAEKMSEAPVQKLSTHKNSSTQDSILNRDTFHFSTLEEASPMLLSIRNEASQFKGLSNKKDSSANSKDQTKEFDDEDDDIEHQLDDKEEISASLKLMDRIYRLIQLLCEGHNLLNQNQLRVQLDSHGGLSGKSEDFITKTAYYFNVLSKEINKDCLVLAVQMLDFLIESVQGPCEGNQQALVEAGMINTCMDFIKMFNKRSDYLKAGFVAPEEIVKANDATTTAIKLLNALLEGNNPTIIKGMASLDFLFLIAKLSNEYEIFVHDRMKLNDALDFKDVTDSLKASSFDQAILEAFDIYILIVTLGESNSTLR